MLRTPTRGLAVGIAAALLLWGAGAKPAAAQTITNGGFETHNFSGWSVSGNATVVEPSFSRGGRTYTAQEGTHFALLQSGAANVYTRVWQQFTALDGDTLSGVAFFQTNDTAPRTDDGYVRIVQGGVVLFQASVSSGGSTPWTGWEHVFQAGGTYTIEAGVRSSPTGSGASYLGLDAVRLARGTPTSVAPEPASTALFLPGLAALWLGRRRKRKVDP